MTQETTENVTADDQVLPVLAEAAAEAVRAIDAARALSDLPEAANVDLTSARDQLAAALAPLAS